MAVIDHRMSSPSLAPTIRTRALNWTRWLSLVVVLILKNLKPNLLEYLLEMVISVVDDAMDVDDLHPYTHCWHLLIFTLLPT